MDLAVMKLLELKRLKGLTNEDIGRICGVGKQAVTNVFHGRTKEVPAFWLAQIIEAFNLDANYFYRKKAEIQPYTDTSSTEFQTIPLLGRIAASFNRSAEELTGEGFVLPSFMLRNKKQCFALRVSGDSMMGAGILDGDICIIEKQENASALKNGEIAAFRIDGDTTLKYFEKNNGQAWLVPANPKYQPVCLNTKTDIELIGTFVSLLRPPS
ncbi:MAG: LexA repressor [Turneriella sp.]|nr:LexA repressor [Turneriella sp.]